MSDPVATALITALSTIPTAIAAFFSAWFAYRASVHSKKTAKVAEQTERNTNSMKDELVALTRKEAHAAGVKQAQDEAARDERT
jgi:hypothetical protein